MVRHHLAFLHSYIDFWNLDVGVESGIPRATMDACQTVFRCFTHDLSILWAPRVQRHSVQSYGIYLSQDAIDERDPDGDPHRSGVQCGDERQYFLALGNGGYSWCGGGDYDGGEGATKKREIMNYEL